MTSLCFENKRELGKVHAYVHIYLSITFKLYIILDFMGQSSVLQSYSLVINCL